MDSPINSYKYFVKKYGLFGAQKKVLQFFRDKYINLNPDRNNNVVLYKNPFFIPGRIYTYQYDPKWKNLLDWYDTRPLMLSLTHFKAKTGNLIETGINLNFIPPPIRILILQALFNVYKPIIESNSALDKNAREGRQRPLFTNSYNYMQVLDWIFNKINNSAYRFAIRSYIKTRIKYPKAVHYNDMGKCALLETKEMVGASLEEIYKQYWDYRNTASSKDYFIDEKTNKYIKNRVNKNLTKMRKKKT